MKAIINGTLVMYDHIVPNGVILIDDGKSCHILRITEEPIDNLIERAGEIIKDVMAKDENS